jgi:hypothetical protein
MRPGKSSTPLATTSEHTQASMLDLRQFAQLTISLSMHVIHSERLLGQAATHNNRGAFFERCE